MSRNGLKDVRPSRTLYLCSTNGFHTAEAGRDRERDHGRKGAYPPRRPPEGYVCRICNSVMLLPLLFIFSITDFLVSRITSSKTVPKRTLSVILGLASLQKVMCVARVPAINIISRIAQLYKVDHVREIDHVVHLDKSNVKSMYNQRSWSDLTCLLQRMNVGFVCQILVLRMYRVFSFIK